MTAMPETPDSDTDLREAYERLGSSLEVRADLLAPVQDRMRDRRRRRMTLMTLTAAASLVGAGAIASVAGRNGDATSAVEPPSSGGYTSTLQVTREDGSTYLFRDVTVSCQTDPNSGHQTITATSNPPSADGPLTKPFFYFQAVLSRVQGGRVFRLPIDGGSDVRPMTLFAATDSTTGKEHNEVSSAETPASGTVAVSQASCDPTPTLGLDVDATLGSEVGLGPERITGRLTPP
jgi:hypothetical protein